MPAYELSLIVKALQKPELMNAVKRCCTNILDNGGFIRKMENLGHKPLPYAMRNHGQRFREGNYILVHFEGNTQIPAQIEEILSRDTDIIRKTIFTDDNFTPPCLVQPCNFGEIKNPDHEKSLWWIKVKRRFNRSERKKSQRLA